MKVRSNILILTLQYILFLCIGDFFLSFKVFPSWELHAMFDSFIHGVSGVLLIAWYSVLQKSRWWLVYGYFISAGLDVDHFIMARSIRIIDALRIPHRPISHSILFSIIFGFFIYFVFRKKSIGCISGLIICAHVLRDSAGSTLTPWLWPFYSPPIPFILYYIIQCIILVLCCICSSWE